MQTFMVEAEQSSLDVIAMHGWAGDARCWDPWIAATEPLGWRWQCGERGYGDLDPVEPSWPADDKTGAHRLFIGHSLGLHLISPAVLELADSIVLVAAFAAFVPRGRPGRRLLAALSAMAAKLDNEEHARMMLGEFSINSAAPFQPTPSRTKPLGGQLHLERLRSDLIALRETTGLPAVFPSGARTLLVEATRDHIVDPAARALLRETLPGADVISLEGAGHALPGPEVARQVATWVEARY